MGGLLRSPRETIGEHLQLIEAIRRHDVKRAQILAMQHISVTRERLKKTEEHLSALGIDTSKILVKDCLKSEIESKNK
jgi:hypothetical protein